jgi:ribokinase
MTPPRIAVVGHVEHVTLGRLEGALEPGGILHLRDTRFIAGGGGGIAFAQLCRSDAEVHFFTAVGRDEAGRAVEARIRAHERRGSRASQVHVHAVVRDEEHPRVVVVVDREGRRTIVVLGEPLHPTASDPLPWSVFAQCDAVYFTGTDSETLRLSRACPHLVVTARRNEVLRAAQVPPDVVIGSVADPRENRELSAYDPAPAALVLTDGPRPVRIHRREGVTHVAAPPAPDRVMGDYGAGDSFAAAMTYFLARASSLENACRSAGPYGASVLRGLDPLELQSPLVAL